MNLHRSALEITQISTIISTRP